MKTCWITSAAFVFLLSGVDSVARVRTPVAAAYEDSVRVLILYNYGAGGKVDYCPWYTNAPTPGARRVVDEILSFVNQSLEGVTKVKSLPTYLAAVDSIKNAFGPGVHPHVMIHINAGWGGAAGYELIEAQEYALSNNVGMVCIGDDDLTTLTVAFAWLDNTDLWLPMESAVSIRGGEEGGRVFMVIDPSRDTFSDSAKYPFLSGVIKNTRRIAGSDTIDFKPFGENGRCEADADSWGLVDDKYQNNITTLAYQQAIRADASVVAESWDYHLTSVIEDEIKISGGSAKRRVVSLSMQPQFVDNAEAIRQLVYDAVMYASLVHTVNPPMPWGESASKRPGLSLRAPLPSGADVRITNMAGRTVHEGPVTSSAHLRQLSAAWNNGIYVISEQRAGKKRSQTFVVSR